MRLVVEDHLLTLLIFSRQLRSIPSQIQAKSHHLSFLLRPNMSSQQGMIEEGVRNA